MQYKLSLPSRGAWIEITIDNNVWAPTAVAPLAGSVDRNGNVDRIRRAEQGSLPSRGAWIEMLQDLYELKGGTRRSPRGERG